MEAYSADLRDRVIEAYDAGRGSSRQLAVVFGVSSAWIRKLLWLRRETGTVAAKVYRRGPRPRLSDRQLARLAELVRQHSDATLSELRPSIAGELLGGNDSSGLGEAGTELQKKSLRASEQDREDVQQERRAWRRRVAKVARRRIRLPG